MYSKILILRFPPTEADRPIVYGLVKHFDLTFNILNARIFPRKEGVMVLELTAENREQFRKGVRYLKDQGLIVKNADQEVRRDIDKCTHCGACTAVCPTGALYVKRPEMEVVFDENKCSVCEICVPTCPPRAMEVFQSKKVAL